MEPLCVKLVIVGSHNNGKTTLLNSYNANEYYVITWNPGIVDNISVRINTDGRERIVSFWDTAAQSDYDRLRPLSYYQTDVFLLTFSCVNRKSFTEVTDKWFPEIRHHCPDTPILLVATKSDLRENTEVPTERIVTKQEGDNLAKQLGCAMYFETSSL